MLNKGLLLLSQPHESRYAQYRQFLIANRGRYSNASSIRFALLSAVRGKLPFDPAGIGSIDLLKFYRDSSISIFKNKYDVHSQSTRTRPIKNCPKCAEVGFHTDVFDADWLTTCPIHKVTLIGKCHKCEMPWPSCSEILARKCHGCGALVEAEAIAVKITSHNSDDDENLQLLCSLQDLMRKPSVYSINYVVPFRTPSLANRPTRFFTTAALTHLNNPKLLKLVSELEIPLHDYYQRSFVIRPENQCVEKSLAKVEIDKLRSTALRHIRATVSAKNLCVRNRLGSCSKSDLTCPACRAYALFSQEYKAEIDTKPSGKRFSWWEHHVLLSEKNQLPMPQLPSVIDYVKVETSEEVKELELATIRIPNRLKKLLYYYETRLSFLHGLRLFQYLKKCQKAKKTSLVDIYSSAPTKLKSQGLLSSPYYLFSDNSIVTVVVPKISSLEAEL